jgi:hypothetical protein
MPDANNYFWYSEAVQAIKIGDESTTTQGFTSEYNLNNWAYSAIYDTGTSLLYAPGGIGYELIIRLAKGSTYLFDSSSGLTMVDCNEKANY